MSYVQGQSVASTGFSESQLADDMAVKLSGSASSTASVCDGDLYELMPLEDETYTVSSRHQCRGLLGFGATTLVATWQDMRKGDRVTEVSKR